MSLGRIFSSIIAIFLMIGLFIVAFWVFAIVVIVLIGLGILQWLRNKGIIADKKGTFRGYGDESDAQKKGADAPVIEGEFEKVEQNKE